MRSEPGRCISCSTANLTRMVAGMLPHDRAPDERPRSTRDQEGQGTEHYEGQHRGRTARPISSIGTSKPSLLTGCRVADITYVHTFTGWVYVAFVTDECSLARSSAGRSRGRCIPSWLLTLCRWGSISVNVLVTTCLGWCITRTAGCSIERFAMARPWLSKTQSRLSG